MSRLIRQLLRPLLGGALALLLGGCAAVKLKEPMPSTLVSAPQAAESHPLVIVLPGRYDSLHNLETVGIAQAVQQSWPVADVLLVGATPPYYRDGGLVKRLYEQVILPARHKGYRDIWLTGASQGALGTLMYERVHPGDVTGLVLYAPYMGERRRIEQIAAAGGPSGWQPPMPEPPVLSSSNYLTEVWRTVHQWRPNGPRTATVWLACGADDGFLPAAKQIARQLPPNHFLELPGGHDWKTWDQAAREIFKQVAAAYGN